MVLQPYLLSITFSVIAWRADFSTERKTLKEKKKPVGLETFPGSI
jgi:hypothetical protein